MKKKIMIRGISSQCYPGGRLDSFKIPLKDDSGQGIHHSYLIPLFIDLGFSEDEVMDELDIDFENKEIYPSGTFFFIYGNSKIKGYIIIEGENLCINLDTNEERENINKIFEKYFEFPKDD